VIEHAGIKCRVAARGAANRALVNHDYLVQILEALEARWAPGRSFEPKNFRNNARRRMSSTTCSAGAADAVTQVKVRGIGINMVQLFGGRRAPPAAAVGAGLTGGVGPGMKAERYLAVSDCGGR